MRCEYNYYPNKEKCLSCSLEGCLNCYFQNGKEICTTCDYYYKTIDGICSACLLENCKYCPINNVGICNECKNGYELKNGNCQLICSDKNCLNCSEFQNLEYCIECKEGYTIENGKCIKCADENCKKCDKDKKLCTICKDNSRFSNGKCSLNYINTNFCTENCADCLTSG